MLALEIIGVLLLATLGLLWFRHLRLMYWSKDSNNPVQHSAKLPPRPGYPEDRRRSDAGHGRESLDEALAGIRSQLSGTAATPMRAKEKRKRLFRGKADIRRAFIINELLMHKEW